MDKNLVKYFIVFLIWTVVYSLFLWKLPFYAFVDNIKLPPGSESCDINATIQDIAQPFHVTVEKVFISRNKNLQEVREFINEKNNINCEKEIAREYWVGQFFKANEWPELIIHQSALSVPESEREHCYYLVYTTSQSFYRGFLLHAVIYGGLAGLLLVLLSTYALSHMIPGKKQLHSSQIPNEDGQNSN